MVQEVLQVPHTSVPLTARMVAPITEVIETSLEMSNKSVGFISSMFVRLLYDRTTDLWEVSGQFGECPH
jgi:hypothetical protein